MRKCTNTFLGWLFGSLKKHGFLFLYIYEVIDKVGVSMKLDVSKICFCCEYISTELVLSCTLVSVATMIVSLQLL